jgi:predicted O-linked N-acetylglucosamine transferase (SPINDLY family)
MLMRIRGLFKAKTGASTAYSRAPQATAEAASAEPGSPLAWLEQAKRLQQEGRLEEAVQLLSMLIARAPESAEPYYRRGNALNGLGRSDAALEDYERAIGLDPSHAHAFCNRGSVLDRLGRREEALASYERAIALDPADCLAHYNRGCVQKELRKLEEALASYDAAIAINGNYAEAYTNRGIVLQELRQHEAAVSSFDRAVALNPALAAAFQQRAMSLYMLRRYPQSLADYSQAISLRGDCADLYYRRGNLLSELLRLDGAVADYSKAVALDPAHADSHHGLGATYARMKKFELAIASFDRTLELYPAAKYLLGTRRAAKMQICLWDGLKGDLESIASGLRAGKEVCSPMTLAALLDSASLQRSAAEIWMRDQVLEPGSTADVATPSVAAQSRRARTAANKVRLGYFSADLRGHPVAYLTAGLFERHDRSRFEVSAFAFGPAANDAMEARLTKAFDRFIDVRQKSDLEVAALARELEIDIAVDLNGLSEYCRTRIFAARAAPIQVNFLGYPGTLGAPFIDYLIGDATVVPRTHQAHFSEKIVYLPGSFMPFDSSYAIAERVFTRAELDLPADGVVFCCFNNPYKIVPDVFECWMRILTRTPGSVLWLSLGGAEACANLRKEAARCGVDGRRLIFAQRMASLPEHLARLRAADLFLDTLPYNAHATAMDSLWAGVPLLTCPGQSFASRVAASLLSAAGMPELIAASPAEYEEKAVDFATDPARLAQQRSALAQRSAPLFDTERYTRDLEQAYRAIYELHRRGAAPAHINGHLAGGGHGG